MRLATALRRIVSLFILVAALFGAARQAFAFELGVYGGGGYDSVSSAPSEETGSSKSASPNPSGLSYGLGLDTEVIDFADGMVGINVLVGFFGTQLSWETDEEVFPSAISIVMMGLELGLAPTVNIDGFLIRGFGSLGLGLFGNEYYAITNAGTVVGNSEGLSIEYEEGLLMRIAFGAGVGYQIGDLSVLLQGGFTGVTLNVTPPPKNGEAQSEVQDTYTGFGGQLLIAYRLMGGTPAPSSGSETQQSGGKSDAKKKKRRKKKTKKTQKTKKTKKESTYHMEDFLPQHPLENDSRAMAKAG